MTEASRVLARQRLLVLASTFPRSRGDGTPAFVADLARQQALAFDTVVLVPRTRDAPVEETWDGYRVRRFRYFPRRWEDLADGAILANVRDRPSRVLQLLPFLVAEMWAIRRAVREVQPDVVHVHWIVPQGLAALVGARRRPWLVTTHGGDLYALQSPPWRWAKRAVLRRAGAATAMNREMAARLVELGVARERAHIMPMGVDIARIRGGEDGAGVPAAQATGRIVFIGRLVEKKGVAVLLDALDMLDDSVPWSLDVVGDGPLRSDLEARAALLQRAVTFHGQQPAAAVAALLRSADVAAFPSVVASSGDQDGLPVALLEAMAAGCAVVASRIAGIDEAVEDGVHGLLVPPGEPAPLSAAVQSLLTDPLRRRELGDRASVRAESYSVEAAGKRYVGLLRDLIATG